MLRLGLTLVSVGSVNKLMLELTNSAAWAASGELLVLGLPDLKTLAAWSSEWAGSSVGLLQLYCDCD